MINALLDHVTTVLEFNSEIRRQQEQAHGEDYCAIHDAIRKYMADCDSYMELGTHQGGTASVAMLCKPKKIYLVDLDTSKYNNKLSSLATQFCAEHDIELNVKQCDSTSFISVNSTDMLVIDSYHHPAHMLKELNMHGNNVKKYILAHDTTSLLGKQNDSLYRCLKNWASENHFVEIERGETNVGYVVFKRN